MDVGSTSDTCIKYASWLVAETRPENLSTTAYCWPVESHDAATEIMFNVIVKKLCKLLNIEP
jgi:hypothetical protein